MQKNQVKSLKILFSFITNIIKKYIEDLSNKSKKILFLHLLESKTKNQNIKKLEKQTGYTNYEQRERSNWDNFYANSTNNVQSINNIIDVDGINKLSQNNSSTNNNDF